MRKIVIGNLVLFLFAGCTPLPQGQYYLPPSELPFTNRLMKTSGYWISRHPYPDKTVLAAKEITSFNKDIRERLKLTKDLAQWPASFSGKELKASIETIFSEIKNSGYFLGNGKPADEVFFIRVKENMSLNNIPEAIQRQYAIVVHYADQRFFPTNEGLFEKPNDPDFDYLQNSALDVGVPVVVLHESADKKWYYVESSASVGWVEADNIALGNEEEIMDSVSPTPFIIVTDPKADLFLNEEMTHYYDYVLMGGQLPLIRKTDFFYEVPLPLRSLTGRCQWQKGYVPLSQAHEGYLTYTPRTILTQAFKMLNAPYGWGGMYGEQDCSRFVQEVFATVGIELPRDSKNQAKVGITTASFKQETTDEEKLAALKKYAVGGMTLLNLKGHIMLFVGQEEGRFYGIHSIWAYRQPGKENDQVFVLNRVTLSDLSLGNGSKKGSLLKRITSVSTLNAHP